MKNEEEGQLPKGRAYWQAHMLTSANTVTVYFNTLLAPTFKSITEPASG
jgi:hypothetical protein